MAGLIYHMCQSALFTEAANQHRDYFPPTYAHDGFIHATAVPSMLIEVANHFYKDTRGRTIPYHHSLVYISSIGDWICLEIDPQLLANGPQCVVYEAPAPVGDKESFHQPDDASVQKFPHIYGGINASSVIRTFPILRSDDGTFVAIDGL